MALPGELACPKGEENPSPFDFTELSATSKPEGLLFSALKASDRKHRLFHLDLFSAYLVESHGGMSTIRSINASSRSESFVVSGSDGEITSATITPPKPFTGSATYEKQGDLPATWTGSLAGDFLGRGEVSLTGPQFTAKITH